MRYFCDPFCWLLEEPEFWLGAVGGFDSGVPAGPELLPTVPELLPVPLMASNTDIPCGPIVMRTGLPSLDCGVALGRRTGVSVTTSKSKAAAMLRLRDCVV